MAPTSKFIKECQQLFKSKDLYFVLGLEASKSEPFDEKEIKRAYYKSSLKYHPDRVQNGDVSAEEIELATKRFQLLGKVYSILSDPEKKKLYDESGIVDDEDNVNDDFDWMAYWRSLFKKVTVEDIAKFTRDYKGSNEEIDDLKVLYTTYKGDLEKIYESAFCVDDEADRKRVFSVLSELVDKADLEPFEIFNKVETKAQEKRRLLKAQKEAAEAEKMMKEITGKKKMEEEELRNAIAKRGASRHADFIQQLEEKYGGASNKKKATPKRRKVDKD